MRILASDGSSVLPNPSTFSDVWFWNSDNGDNVYFRKEMVSKRLLPWKDDMKLGQLILTKHPRSPETFTHRYVILFYCCLVKDAQQCTWALIVSTFCSASTWSPVCSTWSFSGNQFTLSRSVCYSGMLPNSRKWLLKKLGNTCSKEVGALDTDDNDALQDSDQLKEVLENERQLCLCAAEMYSNNYHAWSHRIWILQNFGSDIQVKHKDSLC